MIFLFIGFTLQAGEYCKTPPAKAVCTDEILKEKVDWACKLIESKGQDAVAEIKKMRFDCCGEPDYVWINTFEDKPIMIMHPIKPMLDGKDLTTNKDPNGKFLFVEFVNALKKTPSGAFVDYQWTKFGEKDPTPKTSWVKKCKVGSTDKYWVAGAGSWK